MADEATVVEGSSTAAALDGLATAAKPRVSWGAILGGAFAALGLWLLLYAFGLAVGLSTVDPNNPSSVKGSGIFTGVWSGVSPIIALFIGGLVAGHLAGVFSRGYGALHGLVMWGLVTVSGAVLVGGIVSSVVAGAASVGKTVVQGGGQALKGVAGNLGGADKLGLDWNDALAPVNQRLQAEGKPPVAADQLQAATRDAVKGSIQTGRFDRAQIESALAANTALAPADIQDISQRMQQQFDRASGDLRQRAQGAADAARTGALKAAEATGKAFWGVFTALALGLFAALGGGALGAPGLYRHERHVRRRRVQERPVRGRPILPQEEAYTRP
jgi:hypothetical protein